ncbi:N-6 DNA methylase [Streptomyces sp. DSM 116494]|uniref:N-6 DNA methylase n=1 Tax=Streptomyces okerensis TaxID=3344655 RepID=UPI00388E8B94
MRGTVTAANGMACRDPAAADTIRENRMPEPTPPSVAITLAQVARIADVGRAAVSNWRRRHTTFPAPVGGTDTSPLFDQAQVEEWLRAQGKLPDAEEDSLERVWPLFEALADRDLMATAVTAVARGTGATGIALEDDTLSAGQRHAVERALLLAGKDGGPDTVGQLVERWLSTHVRQITATPMPLAALMADLAHTVHALDAERSDTLATGEATLLDPACGAGGLLLAAAQRWGEGGPALALHGQDRDQALVSLATARLATDPATAGHRRTVVAGDTLRAPAVGEADVVLCNPPYNERDWGHEELATDPRWALGIPPRTESELAWVQHVLSTLKPGGTAVLLLPPGVAARRAGRRIRAGLLRRGVLRAVIALPPGAAPPHAVALHLWVLHRPAGDGRTPGDHLLLVDTAREEVHGNGRTGIVWDALRTSVLTAVRSHEAETSGELPTGSTSVPVMALLDDQVDLTPARHVPAPAAEAGLRLRRSWGRFGGLLQQVQDLSGTLSAWELTVGEPSGAPFASVEELERAGALSLRAGRSPEALPLRRDVVADGGVRLLTVADVTPRHPSGAWLPADAAAAAEAARTLTVTRPGEIVVVGATRAFAAWVDTDAPTALGPQLYAVRTDPALLDPWFLAGCLNSPANARQAGSHASTVSRIDVRRLQVPRLPLDEQKRYGEAFRLLNAFDTALGEAEDVGRGLVHAIGDALGAASLAPGS